MGLKWAASAPAMTRHSPIAHKVLPVAAGDLAPDASDLRSVRTEVRWSAEVLLVLLIDYNLHSGL